MLGRPVLDSLMFAVALAVGLTPELLPMITSVTLARGALRMAAERVIVRPVYGQHLKQILITMGGMIIGEELIKVIWGPAQIALPLPEVLRGSYLLGDAAVAVNPEDGRYAGLIGKQVRLPLAERTSLKRVDEILIPPDSEPKPCGASNEEQIERCAERILAALVRGELGGERAAGGDEVAGPERDSDQQDAGHGDREHYRIRLIVVRHVCERFPERGS